jgi:hypothetical protein
VPPVGTSGELEWSAGRAAAEVTSVILPSAIQTTPSGITVRAASMVTIRPRRPYRVRGVLGIAHLSWSAACCSAAGSGDGSSAATQPGTKSFR